MTKRLLHESGGALSASEGKWSATLITPGTGSSGVYAAEMLAEYAPRAFKKGMKLWWGHPKDDEGPGARDARDQWGVLDEDASVNAAGEVEGKIRLLPHWKDVVESLGDQASLSIYAMGESDKDGNITALLESEVNSVDIVAYPGRAGSGLKAKLEAARAASETPGVTSASQEKEDGMDKVLEALAGFETRFNAFVNESKVATAAEAQAKVDAEALANAGKTAVEKFRASMKLIEAAELLEPIAESLAERAADGEDITEASIAKAKEQSERMLESAKTQLGGFHEEAADRFRVHETGSDADFSIAGWGA